MNSKTILIAPLHWGLGHASRMIPIIRLLSERHTVIIAAYSASFHLLKKEFPTLQLLYFPSFDIKYSKFRNQILKILLQAPQIIYHIVLEHKEVDKIIKKNKIDIVISDNRFGLWNKGVKTVYITHQLMIKLPQWLHFFEPLLHRIHRFFIDKYDYCWIPDLPDNLNFSGDLSHRFSLKSNYRFVGLLSRFEGIKQPVTPSYTTDFLIILSGPEPQRTQLEGMLTREFKNTNFKTVIILGKPHEKSLQKSDKNILFISHLETNEFVKYIQSSCYIICRAGYTSIMDLAVLGRTAILIPTAGQTEQEYLAKYLSAKKWFCTEQQHTFHLQRAIGSVDKCQPTDIQSTKKLLANAIQELLSEADAF